MPTAKELLLAAGWKLGRWHTGKLVYFHEDGRCLDEYIDIDDNLCDMLIRELPSNELEQFEDQLCAQLTDRFSGCTYVAELLRATAEQKAQALMETYKERE